MFNRKNRSKTATTNNLVIDGVSVTHVYNKSLKNSYITISKNGAVTFKTPTTCIKELFYKKEQWIRGKLDLIELKQEIKIDYKKQILYLGTLREISSDEEFCSLEKSLNRSKSDDVKTLQRLHFNFFKTISKEHIQERVDHYSTIMQLEYTQILWRKMNRRWGSCSCKKVLTFNIKLMQVDVDLIDYVVVHELAHIKHMNHSREFHALVRKYMPQEKSLRDRLKRATTYS